MRARCDRRETGGMEERRRTLGAHITRLRQARELSQNQLAQALDVSRTIVSAWENDRRRPRRDNLSALERVLDAPGELAIWRARDDYDDHPGSLPALPTPLAVSEYLRRAADGLVAHITQDTHRDGRLSYGWRRQLNDTDTPVTALATAYGLKAILVADAGIRRTDLGRIRAQLRRLELADGGWTAFEEGSLARPDATAVVLDARLRAGEARPFVAKRTGIIVETLSRRVKDAERARLYVLTTSLLELSGLPIDEATATPLIDNLVDLSIVEDGARSWPIVVPDSADVATGPSTVHTAIAVCALAAWHRRLRDERLVGAIAEGRAWLERQRDLTLDGEEIRSERADGGVDVLPIYHFTPALVLRALVEAGSHAESTVVTRALRETVRCFKPDVRLWQWPYARDTRPVWMTYHSVVALRAWALAQLVE
jgi:transcriptional regulator with XRE-family HTH domain